MKNSLLVSLIGLACVITWLALFMVGLTIDSAPYRDCIASGEITFSNMVAVFFTYTITNTALLCCLAGEIGAIVRFFQHSQRPADPDLETTPPYREPYALVTGLLRGFLVYLLMLAGVYATTSNPFDLPTPEQYARMAGTVSLLAFLVSYEPQFFQRAIGMVSGPGRVATGVKK